MPNLQRFEAAKVVATPDGSELPYYLIAELYFEDLEQLQDGFASDEGQAVAADFQNFVTGGVTLFFSPRSARKHRLASPPLCVATSKNTPSTHPGA